MHENEEKALSSYLEMKCPGYALLVEAPWGAGKTHFVKTVCSAEVGPEFFRYVSLNGVSNEAAFRRALLKESFETSLAEKGAFLGNLLSRKLKLGDLGSMARDIVEERLITKLPDIVIFDDVERSSIDPQVLMGLLNDFVEHKGKRVVLLAHSEAHEKKKKFLKRKEKLVGRTLKITANFDAAFPEFVSKMDEGQGKTYFEEQQEMTNTVFEQAGHQNLRLLRNSIRDCALVLDRVDEDLFDAKEPMSRFVRTYIALAMALAKGEIVDADLKHRANYKVTDSEGIEEELKRLNGLFNRHEGADIWAHGGSVLSVALSDLLFVKGLADDVALNLSLRSTGQFEPQEENPLWKRTVFWAGLGWDDLEALVSDARSYLFETTSVDAGPYLQVADSMLSIAKYGGLEIPVAKLKKQILERIQFLGKTKGVPPAKLGINLGWDVRGRHFSFGGYSCDANDDFVEVMKAMQDVQIDAFQQSINDFATSLLSIYETDLGKFQNDISHRNGETSAYRVPIFDNLNMKQFAKATLRHLKDGKRNELGAIFEKLAERHLQNEDWKKEETWFNNLRQTLKKEASSHSKIARAQLNNFLEFYWKFKEPDVGDNQISEA